MKNISMMLILAVLLVLAGCAGAPDPEPEPEPDPEPEATADPTEVDLGVEERETAVRLRSIVERNEFGSEAPEEYSAAETAFTAGEEAYEQNDQQAVALFSEAAEGYRNVITRGSRSRADRARGEVETRREEARSIRAEVNQRELYEQAESDLEEAETLLENEEFEDAFDAFRTSEEGFHQAYTRARERREEAQRAMNQLDSDLVETAGRLERMQQDMEVDDE